MSPERRRGGAAAHVGKSIRALQWSALVGFVFLIVVRAPTFGSQETLLGHGDRMPSAPASRPPSKSEPALKPASQVRPKPHWSVPLFVTAAEQRRLFSAQAREHRKFGSARLQKVYRTKVYGNTTVDQRSGRKRLYDHNILLRGVFSGKVHHRRYGDLSPRMRGAIMMDIGSALLYGDGAPTVRDIFEDKKVYSHLSELVATDIDSEGAPVFSSFQKSGARLPFAVRPIPLLIVETRQVEELLGTDKGSSRPVILRSANSGPDLYYNPADLGRHLRAIRKAATGRDLIYLFGPYVLFKPAEGDSYEILGTSSARTGFDHRKPAWLYVDWSRRRLREAFLVDSKRVYLDGELSRL